MSPVGAPGTQDPCLGQVTSSAAWLQPCRGPAPWSGGAKSHTLSLPTFAAAPVGS